MRILRWLLILVLLGGAAGAGFLYWQKRQNTQVSTPMTGNEEARAGLLYDSLGVVDFAIRQAQESQDSVPTALIDEHARLWARYTDLRSRLAATEPQDTQAGTAPQENIAVTLPESQATADTTRAMTPVEGFLRQLTGWIWALAGIAALFLGIFLWLLLRRNRSPREAVEFPKARTLRESLSPWEAPAQATDEPTSRPEFKMPAQPERPAQTPFPVPDATLPRRTVDPTFAATSWENTRTTPPSSAVEPSAMQDMILSLSKRGHTPAEIARRLRLPQDQVSLILKMRQAL